MIMIEPQKVHDNANEIESLAKQMKTTMDELWEKVKSLRADWQDEVQTDFDSQFAKLAESFQSFTEQIPSYTAAAHKHADDMKRIGTTI